MKPDSHRTSGIVAIICFIVLVSFSSTAQAQVRSAAGPPSIASAAAAAGFSNAGALAPGSWVTIYGSSLASDTRAWTPSDFVGGIAPLSLDGVTVTVGGHSAFVSYISPQQINALLPSDVPPGPQALIVGNANGTSAPYGITLEPTAPGLWTPQSFNIGGTQYVGAVFADFTTFVLPEGAIPGVPSRPAAPGDTSFFLASASAQNSSTP